MVSFKDPSKNLSQYDFCKNGIEFWQVLTFHSQPALIVVSTILYTHSCCYSATVFGTSILLKWHLLKLVHVWQWLMCYLESNFKSKDITKSWRLIMANSFVIICVYVNVSHYYDIFVCCRCHVNTFVELREEVCQIFRSRWAVNWKKWPIYVQLWSIDLSRIPFWNWGQGWFPISVYLTKASNFWIDVFNPESWVVLGNN